MIEEMKPIDGKPTMQIRISWLAYAKRLKCAYLIIIRLAEPLCKSIPYIVWDDVFLFAQLDDIQRDYQNCTLEMYNPRLDHDRQLSNPIVMKASKQRLSPTNRIYDTKCDKTLSKLGIKTDELLHPSQFDLELWFYMGQLLGAEYMIIALNLLTFPMYYPIYSSQDGLLDRIVSTMPGYNMGAVSLYRLKDSFRFQYMNSAFSTQAVPKKFYNVREEPLPMYASDLELDGFRRRVIDFFCYSQLERPDSELCMGSALELIEYGKKIPKGKRVYAVVLLMKIYDSVVDEGSGGWRILPYTLLLTYYKKPLANKSGKGLCLSNPDPGIRRFGLTCHSKFGVDIDAIKIAINQYYCDGYELRGLLHLLWQTKEPKEMNIAYILEQIKVDKSAGKWILEFLTQDMIKELYLYLNPSIMPNPFADNYLRHEEYKRHRYYNESNVYYALHTDPNPRLQFERERKNCERKAEKGDLQSILYLAAYYFWCEGEYGDYPRALKWIRRGVKLNHPTAICLLGLAYHRGCGLKKDDNKAFELLTKAAQMGYATAYYYLSEYFEYSKDPIRNYILTYAYLCVSKRTVADYPEYNGVEERISYVYRSKLKQDAELIMEALELSEQICSDLVFYPDEPAIYMGEACQKELGQNSLRWVWNRYRDGSSDLPITQL